MHMTKLHFQPIQHFIPPHQARLIGRLLYGEEGEWFSDKLRQIAQTIRTMPKTYETNGQGDNAIAHLRYFAGGSAAFYVTERDMEAGPQHQAMGLAYLGRGYDPELGYISLPELFEARAELDLHYTPVTIGEIRRSLAARDAA